MVRSNIIRTLLSCFIALIFGCLSYSQTISHADNTTIREYLKIQQNCWNEGNIECFMAYYWKSDSLRFVGKDGITYGWKATLERYKERYPDKISMGHLDFEVLSIEAYTPKTVILIGKWQLTREAGDLGGHFSLIWKKVKGEWVIVIDHTS